MTETPTPALVPTTGTVLSFTPASGIVALKFAKGVPREMRLPLIGYAVVVAWVNEDEEPVRVYEGQPFRYRTRMEPVVLHEGMPATQSEAHGDFANPPTWEIVRSDP